MLGHHLATFTSDVYGHVGPGDMRDGPRPISSTACLAMSLRGLHSIVGGPSLAVRSRDSGELVIEDGNVLRSER
jgi:hypothetical protein